MLLIMQCGYNETSGQIYSEICKIFFKSDRLYRVDYSTIGTMREADAPLSLLVNSNWTFCPILSER